MKHEWAANERGAHEGPRRAGHRLAPPSPRPVETWPFVESMPAGLLQVGADCAIQWANAEACRILGASLDALAGKSCAEFQKRMVDADGRPRNPSECPAATCLSTGQVQPQSIAGFLNACGTTTWVAMAAAPVIESVTGRVIGASVSLVEVTAMHQVMDAMRKGERSFRAMAENAITGIWQITANGTTIYLNPAMCRLLEVDDPATEIGKSFREYFSAEMLRRIEQEHAKRPRGVASSYEVELTGAKGTRRFVIISGAPVMGPDGRLQTLIATVTDITEQKQAEQALRRSSDLQRLMLSELDHRVRNNLASLAALIDITAKETLDVKEFAASIKRRVQAMSAAHGLLSRGHWAAMPLSELIESLIPGDLRPSVSLNGPEVLITPRQIAALAMVLQELFANSLKHGSLAGRGRISAEWVASKADDESTVVRFRWRELDSQADPRASSPTVAGGGGQGTSLMAGLVRSELRGSLTLSYPPTGAHHELTFMVDPPDVPAKGRGGSGQHPGSALSPFKASND